MNKRALKFGFGSISLLFVLLLPAVSPAGQDDTKTKDAPALLPVKSESTHPLAKQELDALRLKAGPERRAFVQLFTSDAEPDCTPALVWMSSLKQNEKALWKNFIPIAMHVPEWDSGGYHDPFAKKEFADILNYFVKQWGSVRAYAPTVTVNGTEWSGWGHGRGIPLESRRTGLLKANGTRQAGYFDVIFEPEPALNKNAGFQAHGALLVFDLLSRPSDGKNRNVVLTHDFLPTVYDTASMLPARNRWKASLNLTQPKGVRHQKDAVAFWVTRPGDPTPLQAVGGFLSDD